MCQFKWSVISLSSSMCFLFFFKSVHCFAQGTINNANIVIWHFCCQIILVECLLCSGSIFHTNDKLNQKIITIGAWKKTCPLTETLVLTYFLLLCMIMLFCRYDFFYTYVPIAKSCNCKFGIKIISRVISFWICFKFSIMNYSFGDRRLQKVS